MASIYSWESFIRIHGGEPGARDVFERVMEELLRAENPGKEVHIVKASHGDGGIDVYVHQEDGIDIYQCKFFMGSMDSSRWSQIKNSFSKAMEPKGVKVLRWVLCMPREMQKEDIAKWDEFLRTSNKSFKVDISQIDGNEIIYRMEKCDRLRETKLIEQYFGESAIMGASMNKAIMEILVNYAKSTGEGFRKDVGEKETWKEANIKYAEDSIAFIKKNWPKSIVDDMARIKNSIGEEK